LRRLIPNDGNFFVQDVMRECESAAFPPKFEAMYFTHARYLRIKRWLDASLAAALLLLTAPIIIVCAGLIRVTSRGPVFLPHVRLGRFGQPFRLWKFRTTVFKDRGVSLGAHKRTAPCVTVVGGALRAAHLEGLPQLWNVLIGEISLVGPRPERPDFVPILEASIPNYRQRMLARPGLTGLAQVCLAPGTGIPSLRRKVRFDLHYIRSMDFLLDLRLLTATFLRSAGLSGESIRVALRLPSPDDSETMAAPEMPAPEPRATLEPLAAAGAEGRFFEVQPKLTA
jgi:lipopolysaccharide/colanic/teichoic acid biosynthesis glycosyltransferase